MKHGITIEYLKCRAVPLVRLPVLLVMLMLLSRYTVEDLFGHKMPRHTIIRSKVVALIPYETCYFYTGFHPIIVNNADTQGIYNNLLFTVPDTI